MTDPRCHEDTNEGDDLPELKFTGEKCVLCTSNYGRKKKELSQLLGITLLEADELLQKHGVDRMK